MLLYPLRTLMLGMNFQSHTGKGQLMS